MTEGVFPKVDGDILYASEVNRFYYTAFNPLIFVNVSGVAKQPVAILAHSATAWTALNGANTIVTANAGVTWTNATADNADMTGVSKVCRAAKAKAISCDHNSGNVSFTADSGANWASAATDPAGAFVADLSFPTAAVAVAAMNTGTTRSIYYSTDGGNNWTICAAGPTADMKAIDMFDASNGLAIDTNQKIWVTTNGGVNWSDSGQLTATQTPQTTMIALSATTYIALHLGTSTLETGNTTSGGTVRLALNGIPSWVSNLCKTTSGNVYFVAYSFTAAGDQSLDLFRSTDSGVTWTQRPLGFTSFAALTDLSTYNSKAHLVEYDTNKLLLMLGQVVLMRLDYP